MKLQYVVPLEILRIMGSASQIFDTKNTYKFVLEDEKVRKPLTKTGYGSKKGLYVCKALGEGVSKLVSEL